MLSSAQREEVNSGGLLVQEILQQKGGKSEVDLPLTAPTQLFLSVSQSYFLEIKSYTILFAFI